jgi:hypothetical protein
LTLAIGRVGQWATGGLCILIEAIASQTWVCAGESEERDFSTNEFRRGLNLAIWTILYCCILLGAYSCPCCTRWGPSVGWVFSTSSHQGILEARCYRMLSSFCNPVWLSETNHPKGEPIYKRGSPCWGRLTTLPFTCRRIVAKTMLCCS